jgi:hypothetical protein
MCRLLFLFFLAFTPRLFAQNSCATDMQHKFLMNHSPAYKNMILRKTVISVNAAEPAHVGAPDTVVVVVHVVHLGGKPGDKDNPSDSAIQHLIDGLNLYFSAGFPDDAGKNRSAGVDIGIHFTLAKISPSCKPTNGITRVNGSSNSTYLSSGVGVAGLPGIPQEQLAGFNFWNNTKYLNIWLVNKVGDNAFIGYAYYPTGEQTIYDGVIMQAAAIGRPNILAHEIGHSLSLLHTFTGSSDTGCTPNVHCDEDGDQVCDTDPVQENTRGCYSNNDNPCTLRPYGNMVYNHMSYSCGAIFTAGQKTRMRAALLGYRKEWLVAFGNHPMDCSFNPDQFVSFTTEKKSCSIVRLQWQIKANGDQKTFEPQVSYDGMRFTKLFELDALVRDTNAYEYTFAAAQNGAQYFRIKQLSSDGEISYSAVEPVTINCLSRPFAVYPNPVHSWLNIATGTQENNSIVIYNAIGVKLLSWENTNIKKIDVAGYASGVYIVVINNTVKLRFIKY